MCYSNVLGLIQRDNRAIIHYLDIKLTKILGLISVEFRSFISHDNAEIKSIILKKVQMVR